MYTAYWIIAAAIAISFAVASPPKKDYFNAVTAYSMDFLKVVLNNTYGNVITSPTSVAVLLAMIQQGAEGATLSQLTKVLGADKEKNRQKFGQLSHCYKLGEKKAAFYFTNKMFVKEGTEIQHNFYGTVVQDFLSSIEIVDFVNNTNECVSNINKWVSEHTMGRIQNIIDPGIVDESTVFVLVNAIYFKDMWKHIFTDIKPLMFNRRASTPIKVTGMHLTAKMRAGEDNALGVKWVFLPFRDYQFSMIVILPIKKFGLDNVLRRIKGKDLDHILANDVQMEVELALPKFKLETNLECLPVLQKLGLSSLFSLAEASLPGILDNKTERNNLYVSYIGNKVKLEVDENGATASGASALGGTEGRAMTMTMDFRANHPFLVFLVDKIRNVPLLAGRVSDPSEGIQKRKIY